MTKLPIAWRRWSLLTELAVIIRGCWLIGSITCVTFAPALTCALVPLLISRYSTIFIDKVFAYENGTSSGELRKISSVA
ncbi:hypothetical protein MKW98_018826 [Papaver atlanticum]|uniref:Uncharacterized protein n=1 Tax=Papaver atlanticum TaxID=357466 RepID=A0AAD4TJT0_9MAGN|nr:hypothetical protein MKW98_018826 [Papaver atlanticum]